MALGTASGGRRLNLRGCFDFRDVGGYPAAGGASTRWRSLYRSDGLYDLTGAGRRELGDLGVASVIDLRTGSELAAQGPGPVPGMTFYLPLPVVLPGLPDNAGSAEPELIAESYYTTLLSGVETMREIFAILTDRASYPAVVCCPTGIDRTGIVIAAVLGAIGVPEDVLVRDFAASREATIRRTGRMRFEHPALVQTQIDRFGPGLLGVVPEALEGCLALLREDFGTLAGYAESIDMAGALPYIAAALLDPPGRR